MPATPLAAANPAAAAAVALLALEQELVPPDVAYQAISEHPDDPVGALTTANTGQSAATSRARLYAAIADSLGLPYVDLSAGNVAPDIDLVQRVGADTLTEYVAVPARVDGTVQLAAGTPSAPAIGELAEQADHATVALADPAAILAALRRIERTAVVDATVDSTDEEQQASARRRRAAAPTIALDEASNLGWVRDVLNRAIDQRASDVHLSLTSDNHLRVAYRVDGELRPQIVTDVDPVRAINTMVTAAGMDIGAQGVPQSTSFRHTTVDGRRYNVRAELLPTVNEAEVTLRLLASGGLMTLDQMGLLPAYVKRLRRATERSDGLILVTGPTGHGKTTTLYGALMEVRDGRRKIVAIEDPVEYRIDGITQVEVAPNREGGLGWLQVISSALRSDPDIMLIGEIRDAATAHAAVQASQTGHLVLATLHANNAVAAYARLAALGVDPADVAAQTVLVTGQRLLPKLHSCATHRPVSDRDRLRLVASGIEPPDLVHYPAGCDACDGQGTRGRVPLVEMLSPDQTLRDAVAAGADEGALTRLLSDRNFLSFADEARRLLDQGLAAPPDIAARLREDVVNLAAETAEGER